MIRLLSPGQIRGLFHPLRRACRVAKLPLRMRGQAYLRLLSDCSTVRRLSAHRLRAGSAPSRSGQHRRRQGCVYRFAVRQHGGYTVACRRSRPGHITSSREFCRFDSLNRRRDIRHDRCNSRSDCDKVAGEWDALSLRRTRCDSLSGVDGDLGQCKCFAQTAKALLSSPSSSSKPDKPFVTAASASNFACSICIS